MRKAQVLGQTISYSLSENGIHLFNDRALHQLIKENPNQGVILLAQNIKGDFKSVKGRELQITDESLKAEIWGHYYFEKIYILFRYILQLILLRKLENRLNDSLQEYDCSEKNHDPNRWIWDILSGFNRVFTLFMQDKKTPIP